MLESEEGEVREKGIRRLASVVENELLPLLAGCDKHTIERHTESVRALSIAMQDVGTTTVVCVVGEDGAGGHMYVNGVDVQMGVQAFIDSWKHSPPDFVQVGESIGVLFRALINTNAQLYGKVNAYRFLVNVLRGFGSTLPELSKCISFKSISVSRCGLSPLLAAKKCGRWCDTNTAEGDVCSDGQVCHEAVTCTHDSGVRVDILDAMRHISEYTVGGAKLGMTRLAKVVAQQIVPMAFSCKSATPEIEKLMYALAALRNPAAFTVRMGKNLFVNFVDITRDCAGMVEGYMSEDTDVIGYHAGRVLSKLIIGLKLHTALQNRGVNPDSYSVVPKNTDTTHTHTGKVGGRLRGVEVVHM
eukprot:GDKI01042037.1.p1 GENE.GDKI01042037.1~~GDKI01042037.1.p1  ORF type:complete len:358 (+),score=121.99 GDKI01042037.1:283-1356(+)